MQTAARHFSNHQQSRGVSPQLACSAASRPAAPHRRAFTLVELMISIALALLLILGVNQVFTYTTQAVGAGEAINSDIRSSRAFNAAIANDMAAIVGNGSNPTDAACLIISSRAVYAFRNQKDMLSEGTLSQNVPTTGGYPANNAAFIDLNGDGQFGNANVPGDVVYPCVYNFRNHRLDVLSFFARDTFHRQTGNLGTYVDNTASNEAWIWYGHLWLPDNSGNFPFATYQSANDPNDTYPANYTGPLTFPGAGSLSTNPNNYFASQFVLGRQQIVLREKSVDAANGMIYDNSGYAQRFIDRLNPYPTSTTSTPYATELEPLSSSSQAPLNTSASIAANDNTILWYQEESRFDLAATSIASFRKKLLSYFNNTNGFLYSQPFWFDWMMDGNIKPPQGQPFPNNTKTGYPTYTRFKCNPYVAKPMDAVAMAQANPYMLSGCSQFIVEFAGDFVTQDNDPTHVDVNGNPSNGTPPSHTKYGDILATTTTTPAASASDGVLDFTIVNGIKQIKWYGMPRGTAGQLQSVSYANGDVVPLRDWLYQMVNPANLGTYAPTTAAVAPTIFEKWLPAYPTNSSPVPANYAGGASVGGLSQTDAQTGYTCAFGPNDPKPKLIRITMTLEDPTGRLPEGQTYQYVFQVP